MTTACHGSGSGREAHSNYCMGCHEKGNPDFAATEVDFGQSEMDRSACLACHGTGISVTGRYKIGRRWYGALHLSHNRTDECKSCHFWDPRRTEFYAPSVSTPYGLFASEGSVFPTAERAHSVHVNGSWPKQIVFAPAIFCANCHSDTGCDACHGAQAGAEHRAHGNPTSKLVPVNYGALSFTAPLGGGLEARTCDSAGCHVGDSVPSCSSCHADRVANHGFDPVLHTADESCLGTCHDPQLKNEHDAKVPVVGCTTCHATRDAVATPWDRSCTDCHDPIMHASAAPSHVGTDVAARLARNKYNQACSDTSVAPNSGCHNLSNVATLHLGMEDGGCPLCHGAGRAPASECKTCHTAKGTAGYSSSRNVYPASDLQLTAPAVVVPVSPATAWDKLDDPVTAANDGDATHIALTGTGRAVFGYVAPALPASSTITNVTVYYRAKYAGTGVLPANAGVALKVGGSYIETTTVALTNAYPATAVSRVYTLNPSTGASWTVDQVRGVGDGALEGFGVHSTDASPSVRFTQVYAVVNFSVPQYVAPRATTDWYHHNHNKYLLDSADATSNPYFYPGVNPPGGWSAKYYQDCNAACHRSFVGPAWTTYQGKAMWYSLAGQTQGIPETRTLTLDAGTLPEAAQLAFKTRWTFSATADATGVVEASTDGGGSWSPLTGVVHGLSRSMLTTNSPASWGDALYDLGAYAGQPTLIRFRYNMDGVTTAPGWTIDSLTITGASGVHFSDDAETLKPEWSAYQWFRESGAYQKY